MVGGFNKSSNIRQTSYEQIIERYDMADLSLHYRQREFKFSKDKGSGSTAGTIETSLTLSGITVLFKKGHNDGETIAEYLASKIYDAFSLTKDKAAKCFLLDSGKGVSRQYDALTQPNPRIDIGTIFFPEYSPLFKEADKSFEKRPLFARTFHGNKIKKALQAITPSQKEDLIQLLTVALWLNDYDVHWENLGLAFPYNNDSEKTIVKIDHGWSFADLTPRLGLKSMRFIPGKPTNHFWDYASNKNGIFNSQEYGKCIQALLTEFFHQEHNKFFNFLDELLQNICNYYGQFRGGDAMKSFSKHLGMKSITQDTKQIADYITRHLYERLVSSKDRIPQ